MQRYRSLSQCPAHLFATIYSHSVFSMSMDDLAVALSVNLDDAFPRLVEDVSTRLFWGLRRLTGDAQQAEDLSQEALIKAYRALQSYEPNRIRDLKVQPWLWTIALNLGRNHLRDRSRRPTLVEEKAEPAFFDPDPPELAAWQQRLNRLTKPQREAVVLRHVVGMDIAEIALATGRPEGTCKADIHRGLNKLRKIMEAENEY
jgi:RNA polymerase sigma-70 factor (ECF subfamily)